jgi:hypothetical protein
LFAGFDKEMGTCWYCTCGGNTTSLVPPIVLELPMIRRYRMEDIGDIYLKVIEFGIFYNDSRYIIW